MLYSLVVDGLETKVTLNNENLKFESNGTQNSKYACKIDQIVNVCKLLASLFIVIGANLQMMKA